MYISNICSYAGKSTIHPLRDAKVLKAKFTSEAKLPTASSPLPESPSCDSCHNLEKLDLGKCIFQHSHLSTFNGFRNRPETMVLEPFVQAFLPNIPTKEMKAGNQVFPPILTPHFSQSQLCSIIFQDVPHVSMFFPIFHDIFWCKARNMLEKSFMAELAASGRSLASALCPGQRVTVLSAVPNRSKASNAKDQNDDAEAFLPVPHLVDKELARPLRQRTLQTT